jgi:hypothetical protein
MKRACEWSTEWWQSIQFDIRIILVVGIHLDAIRSECFADSHIDALG